MPRRFLDLEGVEEPEVAPKGGDGRLPQRNLGIRVTLSDLLGSELLAPDERLTWARPRLGENYSCTVTTDGRLRLPDGRLLSSPSGAAMAVADVASYDGWYAWRSSARGGVTLADLRKRYLAAEDEGQTVNLSEDLPSSP